MNKPLGYYTSYVPGEETYLYEIQENHGSSLEKLTRKEKLFLLSSIVSNLFSHCAGAVSDEVFNTADECLSKLLLSDAEGVCEALINQIRWGNHDTKGNA